MRLNIVLLGLVFAAGTFLVMAGGNDHGHGHGHDHGSPIVQEPVSEATAEDKAADIIALLVERKKLDASWASISANSIEQKTVMGSTEWVISFVNNDLEDTSKKTLYIFLTLSGDYIAANHTGQ